MRELQADQLLDEIKADRERLAVREELRLLEKSDRDLAPASPVRPERRDRLYREAPRKLGRR